MSAGRRVVVVGGGLAGIAAALDCAAAGAHVTLVEVRRRLGGAAYSFERDGMHLDNGQHVFLRCCEAYRALLSRIGSERHVTVQERLEIPVMSPGRPTVMLRRGSLPPPLHLAGALARYPHIRPAQRLSAGLAARALSAVDPNDAELDARTLGELARGPRPERAVARGAVGPDRAADVERARGRGVGWRSARSSSRRGCSRAPTRATSAFTSARSRRRSASRPSAR